MTFKLRKSRKTGLYSIVWGRSVIREGLPTESVAKGVLSEFERARTIKITDPKCSYCGGVGGCYMCDS